MTNRRHTLVINAVQQRRFIMGAVLIAIILINSLAIFTVVFNPTLLDAFEISHAMTLAVLEIIIVSMIGYFSLILSHRIAGPAYALARDLKRIASGDLTVQTILRKGDFNVEIAETLNFTARILRTKMKAIKSSLAALETQQSIDAGTREALEKVLHELAYFKTEPSSVPSQSQDEAYSANPGDSVGIVEMFNPHTGK